MEIGISKTSWIRLLDTAIFGYIVKRLAKIKKEKRAWKLYSIKATRSPIWRLPLARGSRANQTIATIMAMIIWTKRGSVKPVRVKSRLEIVAYSWFCWAKRSSWKSSRAKARMTRSPIKFSRTYWLILSRVCCCLVEMGRVFTAT